jgi:ABC-type transport system involved in cytochrome c biogenesis permease subunit
MISGISTTCFAASYAVALLLELARMLLRRGWRIRLGLGFVAAGWIAHTLFLGYRAAMAPAIPLSSAMDWYLVAAWLLVAVHLYLTVFHPDLAQGVFILPLVLALIGAAQFADPQPFPQSPATQIWGAIHGTFWLLGAVAVIIGFVAGIMYLLQAHRLKSKLPPRGGLRLPSLEWLERVNGRAIVISAMMAGIGTLSGLVLNLVNHRYRQDELPWNDPIVWQSGGMFAWLLVAALFNVFYRPARQGRKVAYLTVASFAFLVIFLLSQLFGAGEHGRKGREPSPIQPRAALEKKVPLASEVCQWEARIESANTGRLRLPVPPGRLPDAGRGLA